MRAKENSNNVFKQRASITQEMCKMCKCKKSNQTKIQMKKQQQQQKTKNKHMNLVEYGCLWSTMSQLKSAFTLRKYNLTLFWALSYRCSAYLIEIKAPSLGWTLLKLSQTCPVYFNEKYGLSWIHVFQVLKPATLKFRQNLETNKTTVAAAFTLFTSHNRMRQI